MPAVPDPVLSQAINDYLASQLDKNHPAIPTQNFWANALQSEPMQPSGDQQILRQGDYIAPQDKQGAVKPPSASVPGTSDVIHNLKKANLNPVAAQSGDRITNLSPEQIKQMYQYLQTLKEMNGTEISTQ